MPAGAQSPPARVFGAITISGAPAPPGTRLHAEQVAQIDSKDMDFAVWATLAGRCAHWLAQDDVAGIVVTHGTDTMAETARALLGLANKTIVLTGSMQPARFRNTDAVFIVGPGRAIETIPAGDPYPKPNGITWEVHRGDGTTLGEDEVLIDVARENIGDGVVVADAEGRLVLSNPMAEQLLGPSALLRRPLGAGADVSPGQALAAGELQVDLANAAARPVLDAEQDRIGLRQVGFELAAAGAGHVEAGGHLEDP